MNPICPFAKSLLFVGADGKPGNDDGGAYTGGPFRGVLHTTESVRFAPSTRHYYGHKNPPHFTLDFNETTGAAELYQHFPIDRAARALANPAGGVQTNRQSAIQIEIAHGAARINEMQAPMWDLLRQWMRWAEAEAGIKPYAPQFYDSAQAYGRNNFSRFTPTAWEAFDGWCGHQHVPENDHWDPGAIATERLAFLGLTGEAAAHRPVSEIMADIMRLLDELAGNR